MVSIQRGDLHVTLRTDDPDGQRLLIPDTVPGEWLARLLVKGSPEREGNAFVIPHDVDVDRRILNLIDVLTTVRWAHPTFTQLTLDLSEEDAPCRPSP